MQCFKYMALCIYGSVLLAEGASAQQAAHDAGKISVPRYVVGGVLGTTLGLGI